MKKKKKDDSRRKNKYGADSFYRFVIFFLSLAAIVTIISYDRRASEWKLPINVGEPAPKDIFSPFNFTYIDEAKTAERRDENAAEVLPIYKVDDAINAAALKNLDVFLAEIEKARLEGESAPLSDSVRNVISDVSLREVLTMKNFDEFKNKVRTSVVSLLEGGLISFTQKVDLLDKNKRAVTLLRNNAEREISVIDLVSLSEARDNIYQNAMDEYPRDRRLRSAFSEIVNNFLEANVIFDDSATRQRQEKIYKETPPVEVNVKKNEIVVRRGKIITPGERVRLQEIEKKITKKKVAYNIIGVGMITLLYLVILACYLYAFERKIYGTLKDILLINTAIVFTLLVNKAFLAWTQYDMVQFLLPSSFAALLVAILIKPRVAVIVAGGMAVFAGLMTNYDPLVIITTMFAGTSGIFLVLDVRRRTQFFFVGALVGLVNFILILGFLMLQEMTLFEALHKARAGLLNGAIITVLFFPGLWFFENLFGKTTAISLLELSDLNHPLLKRLIIEAPGTYHHSLVVSNLAESASEAIGANALLARVGSYFHDIGKIEKAGYFTENQTAKDKNYHDNLSPRMSYFIIVNHVKDGIELARKYKLNRIILDFIAQHHGASVVYFFYKKALDEKNGDENVSVSDFRYAGPKPQSKEIAITLLADTVEAASRALSEPTPGSLRGLVEKVVNDKFLDNQLDECDLTLLDLHKIKESFVRNLMAIFHTRVEYPEMMHEGTKVKRTAY